MATTVDSRGRQREDTRTRADATAGSAASPFAIDFGEGLSIDFSAHRPSTGAPGPEILFEGRRGLMLAGVAAKALETDRDGEHLERGALADSVDMWGLEDRPPVWFAHGQDAALGGRAIGWAVDYDLHADGLEALCFIPRDVGARWRGPGAPAARQRFAQVYDDIRDGRVRGYSIGGGYHSRPGSKALTRWMMTELSVAPYQSVRSATFHLLDQSDLDLLLRARRLATELEALTHPR